MALNAEVDTLDDVAEPHRELYVETEDGFRLDVDGVEFPGEVAGLKSALEREREARKTAKRKLSEYDGIDPEQYRELTREQEKRDEDKAAERGELRERLEAKHAKERQKLEGEIAERDSFIERLVVDRRLSDAIDEVGVRPEYREAVKALMRAREPEVVREDGEYLATVQRDGVAVELAEYVADWGESDAAAPYLPPSGNGGSGATGSAGQGGRITAEQFESMSSMERTELFGKDPELYRELIGKRREQGEQALTGM